MFSIVLHATIDVRAFMATGELIDKEFTFAVVMFTV
jgi:hypothetical protein